MSKKDKKEKKRKSLKSRVILLVLELVVLVGLVGAVYIYQTTYGELTYTGEISETEAGINEDIDSETVEILEGYTNIALFGLDNRSSGDLTEGNSDTIMIASIDNASGEVRLVSIYRDTYLNIGDGKYRKANAAYANGGPTNAVSMINTNLDLDITEYMSVDWLAVVEAIQALGGLDLEITDKEVSQINHYMGEVEKMTGIDSEKVTESGLVHLDGVQACTYARIRKTSGDDYLRTSRQRIVLQAMMDKAKQSDLATLKNVASEIFDDVSTSLTLTEILGLMKNLTRYDIVSTTGFPFELTTKYLKSTNDTVVPINLEKNVEELHEYLFGDEEYTPSETVHLISEEVSYYTEVYDGAAAVNTSLYNETVGANGTEAAKTQNAETETETETETEAQQ